MPTAARQRAWSKDLAYVAKIVNIFVRMIAYHSGHGQPKSSSKIVNIHGLYGGHKSLRSSRRMSGKSSVTAVGGHRQPRAPLINDHIVNKLDGNLRWRC
jgi:hypothetical protein